MPLLRALPITAGALLLGCSGAPTERGGAEQTASASSPEQARVAEILRTRGFDTTQLNFGQDGTVLVEGDVLMKVKDILDSANSDTEKGYWKGQTVSPGDIYLNNNPVLPVSPSWVWAFVTAASNWNNDTTNIHFRLDQAAPPGAHQITISAFDFVAFGLKGATTCSTAYTTALAGDGTPASQVNINSGYNCSSPCAGETGGIEGLPDDYKVKIATHELGHAIGLMHPADGQVIPYTQTATCCTPNYASVMWQGCLGGNIVSTPSQDDALSVYVLGY